MLPTFWACFAAVSGAVWASGCGLVEGRGRGDSVLGCGLEVVSGVVLYLSSEGSARQDFYSRILSREGFVLLIAGAWVGCRRMVILNDAFLRFGGPL
jgi:hypothetical protein